MTTIELYQSVLKKLADIPQIYLTEIDEYLSNFTKKIEKSKSTNSSSIMALSGSWSDMEEDDFNDFLIETRNSRNNLFDRKFDL